MRHRRRVFCWIFIWAHLQIVTGEDISNGFVQSDNPITKDLRGLFSPRMDYDQWKPLGRGDPLKNDPTYDYVPPVLDRVHYWIDPALRKPDPPIPGDKTEILLLGVSSKKPSTADSRKDNYDTFLKFVDGPKFTTRPHYSSYFPNNFYTKSKNEQRVPLTMLVPPPPSVTSTQKYNTIQTTTNDPDIVTTTVSPETNTVTIKSDAEVTVQAANLIYHSSSLSDDWWTTESSTNPENIVFQKHQQLPEHYVQAQFAPHNLNETYLNSDHTINYVTPPPLINKEIMHKGEVSDDNLDISNTYVKIGKTEAQVHPTGMDNIPEMLFGQPSMGFSPMNQTPMTMQTIQSLQSMQPPAITTSPVFKGPTNVIENEKPTTPATTTTSTVVNPVLKQFNKSPVYLIIQGHSKVKTYGPSKQFHGISVQETNEIPEENHLKQYKGREARAGKLETLKHVIQTKLGAIDFEEAEVHFGYKVGEDVTSEKYHKGIVEEARRLRIL